MAFDGSTWQTPSADVTWTDVSDSVLVSDGVQITRGRATNRDEVQAGTCTLTLKDQDRRFDAENASGPYYGFLNPGVPVWVTVTVGATTYDRFYGFVEDFPQVSPDPADRVCYVPIEAVDAFGMLALARQPESVLEVEILVDDPIAYWRLSEQAGAVARDSVGVGDGEYLAGTSGLSTTATSAAGSELRGIDFDGEHYIEISEGSSALTGRPCVLEAVVAPGPDNSTGGRTLHLSGSGATDGWFILNFAAPTPETWTVFGAVVDGGGDNLASSEAQDTSDYFHHVAYRRRASSTDIVYIDGVDDTDSVATYAPSGFAAAPGVVLGHSKVAGAISGYHGFAAHVAAFDADIGATRIAAHAEAALAPLDGQMTGERIGWMLDQAGFPTADRNLTTGYSPLGPANLNSEYTLDLVRRVEKSEQGRFFIARNGDATFHARYHGQLVATTPSATFSDTGSSSPYRSVEVVRPRRFIFNKVTVSTDGQVPVTVQDDSSIGAHGERETTVDAPLLPSTTAQRSLGEYVLAWSKDPQPRVFNLSVPLHKNFDTLGPDVLALEQGDRVAFERTPLGAGDPISWEQTLEGYTERFDSVAWTWTPHLSPAEPVTFGVWGTGTWGGSFVWGY